jgi:hypothetical protein
MIPYVKEIVQRFTQYEHSKSTAATPEAEYPFKVNDVTKPLGERQATVFNNVVTKCLFLLRRVRPDIATAVAFLTTRVKTSDEDDLKKLARMI